MNTPDDSSIKLEPTITPCWSWRRTKGVVSIPDRAGDGGVVSYFPPAREKLDEANNCRLATPYNVACLEMRRVGNIARLTAGSCGVFGRRLPLLQLENKKVPPPSPVPLRYCCSGIFRHTPRRKFSVIHTFNLLHVCVQTKIIISATTKQ